MRYAPILRRIRKLDPAEGLSHEIWPPAPGSFAEALLPVGMRLEDLPKELPAGMQAWRAVIELPRPAGEESV